MLTRTLSPIELTTLRELKDYVRLADAFEPDVIDELNKERLIRRLGDGKIAISGIGIDYLLAHPEERRPTPLPDPATPPVLPGKAPSILTPASVQALRQLADHGGVMRREDFSAHHKTLEKLIRMRMIEEVSVSEIGLTPDGVARLAQQPPNDSQVSPDAPPAPTIHDTLAFVAHDAELQAAAPEAANVIEISVSADTPTEALEALNEVTQAINEAVAPVDPPLKSSAEIVELKRQWRLDSVWDIETTEGFEAYRDELLAFRLETEAEWRAAAAQRGYMETGDAIRAAAEAPEAMRGLVESLAHLDMPAEPDCDARRVAGNLDQRVLGYLMQHSPAIRAIATRVRAHFAELDDDAETLEGLRIGN